MEFVTPSYILFLLFFLDEGLESRGDEGAGAVEVVAAVEEDLSSPEEPRNHDDSN